jgi:hypothetical protein
MILQSAELSPGQKAAIEETVGPKLVETENVARCGALPRVAGPAERESAVLAMRYRLCLLDRAERRMSIEEWIDALLSQSPSPLNTTEH